MQSRYDRHAQFAQQRQDMAARPAAEYAVFELQGNDIDAVDVQESGGAAVRVDVLLGQLEAHSGRVRVARFDVVYRQSDASCAGVLGGERLAQIRRERGDTALTRQVIADKGDTITVHTRRITVHKQTPPCWRSPFANWLLCGSRNAKRRYPMGPPLYGPGQDWTGYALIGLSGCQRLHQQAL